MDKNVPINKGNYSMETKEREVLFDKYKSEGWEEDYKQYRCNWERYAKERVVSEYPLLVDAELSCLCNLRCPMCYTITDEFKKKVNAKLMDFSLYKKIIDEIGNKVPALRLSYRGEPTVHPKFIECIKYAKENGIKEVSFLTNGSNLSKEYFEKVLLAGADWITISIDGVGETYESIRKPLKFKDTLEKIINIKKIKDKYKTNKPVIKIQSVWSAIKDSPEEFYNTFRPYVDLIAFNPLINYSQDESQKSYVNEFSCPQIYQRIVIGADGKVMPCTNDEQNDLIVGDANTHSIYEIWHGEKFEDIRKLHNKKDGFRCISVCTNCYLPRLMKDSERAVVNSREFIVKDYV